MSKDELFTTNFTKGKRTYFFDVKKSNNDTMYIEITESKKTDDGFERHSVMVFEEDVLDFRNAFTKTIAIYNHLHEQNRNKKKESTIEAIRETIPNDYKAWSLEDDKALEYYYFQGLSIKEIAETMQRTAGAISSRILKIGLNTSADDQSD
ncbi:MAG: DUF3276 family protein [Ignavibacteria bacterium]|jgi:predicted DNA-binding protein YlxM (UPF0122 family)|nr:DUF3276 family protein [Ignavibacteria bacterium]